MAKRRHLDIDWETFSERNLKKCGAAVYARHPSTEILLGAWSWDHGETIKQWDRFKDPRIPAELEDALLDERVDKFAWNAAFEMDIIENVLGFEVRVDEWTDPMVLAQSLSLPGKLAEVGRILRMPEEDWKDSAGTALINFWCSPRKPTKTDNRTRNYPWHNKEKWERFCHYNKGDVRAQAVAWQYMKPWDMRYEEWEMWWIDREINSRGVPVNRQTIDNAIRITDTLTEERLDELDKITGLKNSNSPAQLLPWLRDHGYEFYDLKSGHVKRSLEEAEKSNIARPNYIRALELRTEIASAAVKKWFAYEEAMCDDDVVRNMFRFNGAQRTGRWSGALVQLQNMMRPPKWAEAQEVQEELARALRRYNAKMFDALYPKAFEALATGVRTAIQAPDGYLFVDADFNAIENRVLGWIANDQKILDVFRNDRDPYIDFATYMYGIPYEELWHEYKELKQKGKRTIAKPGVLGCLGPDTPVLTDNGWKRIVDIRETDKVHDGVEFVEHGGVAYRGAQEVLCRSGIYATHDHKFLTGNEWSEWCLLASRPRVFETARASANGLFASSSELREAAGLNIDASVFAEQRGSYPDLTSYSAKRLSAIRAPRKIGEAISANASERSYSIFSQIVSTLRAQGVKTPTVEVSITTEGEAFVCGSKIATNGSNTSSIISALTARSKLTGEITTETTGVEIFGSRLDPNKILISDTWDVVDAGPRNRFVVMTERGPLVAHNCGYMLSAGKEYEDERTGEIQATGLLGYAWGMGVKMKPDEAEHSVKVWRDTFTDAVDFWYDADKAFRRCIRTGKRQSVNMVDFEMDGPFLKIILPSGRPLHYLRPRIEMKKKPWGEIGETITYEGIDSRDTKKAWKRISTHPGKITENIDQAIANDLLREAIKRAERRGLDCRLHIHDQLVILAREDRAERDAKILQECMEEPMEWARDLPLKAKPDIFKFMVKT